MRGIFPFKLPAAEQVECAMQFKFAARIRPIGSRAHSSVTVTRKCRQHRATNNPPTMRFRENELFT